MEGRIVKMEMMLQTQNLCKYFRKQKAVNNVSLNIEKKQIYGLLGPNGAGKSTTLKMLTGMMKPTAGKIYFDGKLLDRKDLSKIPRIDHVDPDVTLNGLRIAAGLNL